ncbi:hypothetical protein [Bradyrhizobium elkanii]|uniref:Uncharacterized protein n=1 Tax=Bradyrhizobium elkanii TaxID=29448 RepID=A0ABV4F819_BRAEL|nr:hypothetical protein [Bradyrhizobium elkanii]MCP1751185.1 hypothetical protein [Bradyrhizobium elkanii]MCP1976957.1 hypothetical protein [Bradyrhizobium elkanii]MCS3888525.1 hypothetical protein [Bradyrhizobium elkanii]MCS4212453.1 hypothetical protein [Bradyrhizobium elkanii]MCW2191912.1 hypothetical protein [Bradyrhizobium elkanii]
MAGDGKKGVQWKPVKISSLSKEAGKLYESYSQALAKTKELSNELKDRLREDWNKAFPEGIDGKACAFNVMGETIQYTMTEKAKQKAKSIDEDEGDDVFSRPQ